MKVLTENEFVKALLKVQSKNKQKEYRKLLKQERKKLLPKWNVETSKLIAIYLFALLNAIIIYAMAAMWQFADLSYLGVLISDIAAQVLIYAIYCLKAYHGKKQAEKTRLEEEKMNGHLADLQDTYETGESEIAG